MFKKFFKFLYGYVIIKVYGKGAERFINICLRRNIDVWNIKPFDDGIENTSSTDTRLKSPLIVCFNAEAATANSNASP